MTWPLIQLSDLSTVITKGTTPTTLGYKFVSEGVGFLRVQNIEGGTVNFERDTLFIDEQTHKNLGRSQIQPGDVLVSIAGTIGRAGVVPDCAPFLNCNQAVAIIRTNGQVFRPFLRHWLESPLAQEQMRGVTVTGTISNLSLSQLGNLQIPLPPLPEQKRIAAILDKADSIRRKRQEAVRLTDDLLRSVFLEMFGDPVTNPKGWKDAALTDVAEIVSGVTKGRNLDGKQTVLAPYLRVANVQDGYLNLSEIKEIEVLPSDIAKYRLIDGDILLTEGGDPDKLGRGTVWREHVEDCIHQNHIFRVRIKTANILPDFLSVLIGSERGKRYFLRAAKQTTGIASINSTQLKNFPVLIPSLDLQQRFAKGVVSSQKLKRRLIETDTATETLFSSLLKRAFKGEL